MHDTGMDLRRTSDKHYMRKIKKPVIEKRRRDRINSSLSQLKAILLAHVKKHGGVQTSRLDKADILELTVRYMTGQTTKSTVNRAQYRAGYQDCARETLRYLDHACAVTESVTSRLRGHLMQTEAIQTVTKCSNTDSRIPIHQQEPISIQIPTANVSAPLTTRTGSVSSSWDGSLLLPVTYDNLEYHEDSNQHTSPHAQVSPDSGVDTSSYSTQDMGDSDISECESCDSCVWRPW